MSGHSSFDPVRIAALCGLCLAGGFGSALAQFVPRTDLVRSISGQFLIQREGFARDSESVAQLATNQDFVRLQPALLAVSSERIKQLLQRQLDSSAPWQGRVYLVLYPAQSGDEPITLDSEHYRDGWQYRLELPDVLERDRYVRALVQVLLLEEANCQAGDRSAEIPLWLAEGLTRRLLASSEIEIILPPPRHTPRGLELTRTLLDARKPNPLTEARKQLLDHPPLTFQELSWPAEDQLSGDQSELYRASAQLFVGELLRFRDGPACLRAMLAELPEHLNWQFAFLHAFQGHFARLIDVEKWWAVQSLQFTSRGPGQSWPLALSWQKLDETLSARVQVRTETNELPLRADVTLQTILREWDGPRRIQALQGKLRELSLLRQAVAHELSGLVADYCQTIETYLNHRTPTGLLHVFEKARTDNQRTAEQTLLRLDALDARRDALRSSLGADTNAPVRAVDALLTALRGQMSPPAKTGSASEK